MPRKKKTTANLKNDNDGEKVAFVISPIGEPNSPTRKRADQILNHVIEPVVSDLGYKSVRADKISKPGVITSQIISHLLDDPLVIADLTGQNPNVFYELAVRHTVKKPIIQMIQEGERIPFDVSTTRTIQINHQDLDSVDKAKKELRKQIKAVEKDPTLVDSPISMAVDLQTLKQSSDPESKTLADLRTALQEINQMVKDIHYRMKIRKPEVTGEVVDIEDYRILSRKTSPIGDIIMETLIDPRGIYSFSVTDPNKGTIDIFDNELEADRRYLELSLAYRKREIIAKRQKRKRSTKP